MSNLSDSMQNQETGVNIPIAQGIVLKLADEAQNKQVALKKSVSKVVTKMEALLADLKDDETAMVAENYVKEINRAIKDVEAEFGPSCDKAKAAHVESCRIFDLFMDPLKKAKGLAKIKLPQFRNEQDLKRRQEEERLRAEEKKRVEDAKIAQAIEADNAGEKEVAHAILEEISPVMAPVNIPKPQGAKGVSYPDVYLCEVINEDMLIAEALKNPAYRHFVMVDLAALKSYAKMTKAKVQIPGCRTWKEKGMSSRAA